MYLNLVEDRFWVSVVASSNPAILTMRKAAEYLRVGDKLVNPQTGEHVSTVIEKQVELFSHGVERAILTVQFKDGKEITRDVSLEYTFEVQES